MPAGAISMFGPGTKSLLSEGLKKRQPSTSEESEKAEEVWMEHCLTIFSWQNQIYCVFTCKMAGLWAKSTQFGFINLNAKAI